MPPVFPIFSLSTTVSRTYRILSKNALARAPVHISQAQLQNLCKTYDMYKFPRSGEPKAFICPFNKGQWPGFELRTGDFVQLHPNGIFPPRLLNILISF